MGCCGGLPRAPGCSLPTCSSLRWGRYEPDNLQIMCWCCRVTTPSCSSGWRASPSSPPTWGCCPGWSGDTGSSPPPSSSSATSRNWTEEIASIVSIVETGWNYENAGIAATNNQGWCLWCLLAFVNNPFWVQEKDPDHVLILLHDGTMVLWYWFVCPWIYEFLNPFNIPTLHFRDNVNVSNVWSQILSSHYSYKNVLCHNNTK